MYVLLALVISKKRDDECSQTTSFRCPLRVIIMAFILFCVMMTERGPTPSRPLVFPRTDTALLRQASHCNLPLTHSKSMSPFLTENYQKCTVHLAPGGQMRPTVTK